MSENSPELTFERVFASPSLNGPAPRQVKFSPDAKYLTLLRNRDDDAARYDLWGYEFETREWRMLVDSEAIGTGRELSEDEKMQRERARVGNLKGIISYQWASDGSGVLVPLDGDLYFYEHGYPPSRDALSSLTRLVPQDDGTYVFGSARDPVRFERDAAGRVVRILRRSDYPFPVAADGSITVDMP